MENKFIKLQLKNQSSWQLTSRGLERRNQQRREQPDRREITRFGYEIVTRRSGHDRRSVHDS